MPWWKGSFFGTQRLERGFTGGQPCRYQRPGPDFRSVHSRCGRYVCVTAASSHSTSRPRPIRSPRYAVPSDCDSLCWSKRQHPTLYPPLRGLSGITNLIRDRVARATAGQNARIAWRSHPLRSGPDDATHLPVPPAASGRRLARLSTRAKPWSRRGSALVERLALQQLTRHGGEVRAMLGPKALGARRGFVDDPADLLEG